MTHITGYPARRSPVPRPREDAGGNYAPNFSYSIVTLMEDLEKKISLILERNKRVEADKAWEVSFLRRGFIALITYVGAYLLIKYNDLPTPGFQALIPSGAYVLSTLSLPPMKKWWLKSKRSSSRGHSRSKAMKGLSGPKGTPALDPERV